MATLFTEFIEKYAEDPVSFVRDILECEPDPWQKELMEASLPKCGNPNSGQRLCAVKSGHGVGKSTTASWIALHNIICQYPQKTVLTAPTSAQLFDALFAELKSQLNNLPPALKNLFEVSSDRIVLKADPSGSFISCRTSRPESPESLQGIHSPRTLLIADESSIISSATFESAGGSLSSENATLILLGNPTRPEGYFYDAFTRLADKWWLRTVSSEDSPRVSKDFVTELEDRYGRDSQTFRIRCLGEFPETSEDTLISNALVESAVTRDVEPTGGRIIWGLDIARFGTDKSALCKRQGNTVLEPIKFWSNQDTMALTGAVYQEYEKALQEGDSPDAICADVVGLGASVCDRGSELGMPIVGINTGESASLNQMYKNLRCELWHQAKEWFEARDCKIPRDNRLMYELCSPRYSFDSTGRIKLETKDEMRKRLGGRGSPDFADAFVLTFGSVSGVLAGASRPWNQPLRRSVGGIV
ncbi:MAG: phage terminase large subunit [bacterium]